MSLLTKTASPAKEALPETEGVPKIRTYALPPAGFDPLKATDKELLHHGFPTRPDAAAMPELRRDWERFYSQPLTYVLPTFERHPDRQHGPCLRENRKRHTAGNGKSGNGSGTSHKEEISNDATSYNWSGVVCSTDTTLRQFQWVYGQWTVPNVYAPTSDGTTYYCAVWVGIDGDGSNDVFQAGTQSDVSCVNGSISRNTYLWYEWYPNGEMGISSVPVSPGDVVTCLLCADSSTSGSVFITNLTSKVHTSFSFSAPSGTTLIGNCAEWVVERPSVNGSLSSLAEYGNVYFDGAYATAYGPNNVNQITAYPNSGTLLDMINSAGTTLSNPTQETAQLIKLTYDAS